MKRLFYFATEKEAQAVKRLLGVTDAKEPGLYPCSQGYLLIGGMGILQTALSLASSKADVEEVWNFGIAATLSLAYPIETAVRIRSVRRPEWFPQGLEERSKEWHGNLFPSVSLNSKGARLVSVDYPIHQTHLADTLRKEHDLIDMEGYGFVYGAKQLNKRCFVGKWVTDSAAAEGPTAIQKLLNRSSCMLADWLEILLKNPPETTVPL